MGRAADFMFFVASKGAGSQTPANLQGNAALSDSGGVSSLAYKNANTPGSALTTIVFYVLTNSSPGDLSLSDGINSWSKIYSHVFNPESGKYVYVGIFEAPNSSGSKLTIGISGYDGSVIGSAVFIEEWSGLASSPVDGTAYGAIMSSYAHDTSLTTFNGPSITTSANGDLIYSAFFDYGTKVTMLNAGSGFSPLQAITGVLCLDEYEIQSSAGAIVPTLSIETSAAYTNGGIAAAVAFKHG